MEAVCQGCGQAMVKRRPPTCADDSSTSLPVATGPVFARCTEAACRVLHGAMPYKRIAQHSQVSTAGAYQVWQGRCWPKHPPHRQVMQ